MGSIEVIKVDFMQNTLYRASLQAMLSKFDISFLNGKTVMVTGATGMLGHCLIDALAIWNKGQQNSCRIIAVSRNVEMAKKQFSYCWKDDKFSFLPWDICDGVCPETEQIDYVIHAASNADPAKITAHPVDTLVANTIGTKNLIEHGIQHRMQRFLYVSSGEVYGQPDEDMSDFVEDYCGPLDLSSMRSCYPEGKRAGEVLCQSYIYQENIDAVIVRPCHLFGPTAKRHDSRATSEFLWRASIGETIVMKSAGLRERSQCYIVDAVYALLLVLRDGRRGEAYNIAAPSCQATIRAFAEQTAKCGDCQLICIQPTEYEAQGYSKISRAVLDSHKLQAIGWVPQYDLQSGIRETLQILSTIQER